MASNGAGTLTEQVYVGIRKDVLNERGQVDITKLKPVSRNGDISYARVGDAFRLPRPAWAEEGEKISAFLGQAGGSGA